MTTVRSWRERFAQEGLAKLGEVRKGRGRKPSISADKVAQIVEWTLHSKPDGHTHWSCRTVAAKAGVSPATVLRIWDARGLKPHRVDTFKLSNDPKFEHELVDLVGLYLNPPGSREPQRAEDRAEMERDLPARVPPPACTLPTRGRSARRAGRQVHGGD